MNVKELGHFIRFLGEGGFSQRVFIDKELFLKCTQYVRNQDLHQNLNKVYGTIFKMKK